MIVTSLKRSQACTVICPNPAAGQHQPAPSPETPRQTQAGLLHCRQMFYQLSYQEGLPTLLFTWDQTMMEVMKMMVTSLKRSMHVLLHSVPPTLKQATTNPCLHQKLSDTHRQVQESLLCGHCSFYLGPGAQGSVVPSESPFPSPM